MNHHITETDRVFSTRVPMWHGLGEVWSEYPTIEEARERVLNWEPIPEPVYRKVPIITATGELTEIYTEVEGSKLVARSDNAAELGVVNTGFELVKNAEMFDIIDALEAGNRGNEPIKLETGGSLKGGRKVFLLARLEEPIKVTGDPNGDTIQYYALQNSHDGSGAFRGQALNTRIVCHERGTPILHAGKWVTVEEHPSVVGTKVENGLAVHIAGMPNPEVVTLDHRYMGASGEWVEAQNLRKGVDEIAYPVDMEVVEEGRSEEFWWAVGLWWADGNLHGDRQVTWTVSDPEVEDRLMTLLREHGFAGEGSAKRGCRQITFSWTEFRSVVEPMYRGTGSGKGGREKIPTHLMEHLPTNLQEALIAGYFDGDGSWDKSKGGMIFSSCNLEGLLALRRMLARQGRASLIRFGRKASLASTIEGRSVNARDQYTLRVPENPQDVRVENGTIYSKVRLVEWVGKREFVPITTEDHTYITHFGRSHNCDNTSRWADFEAKRRGTEFVFRHTKNIKDRIEEAQTALAGWRESINAWSEMVEVLVKTPVTEEQRKDFVELFIPMPKSETLITDRVRNNVLTARGSMQELFESKTLEGISHTAYGLVQAGIEWGQHVRATKGKTDRERLENRFSRAYLDNSELNQTAVKIVKMLVNV